MNILMLGRWLPPPRRPVRGMREYEFARHLARHHRLTLAFVADNPDAAGAISALRSEFGDLEFSSVPRGWKSLASAVRLATGESCTLSYFRSQALRTRLAERVRQTPYDLVFVSSSTMIQYAFDVDETVPMVMDFGSVGSEWWQGQASRGTFPGTRFFGTEAARLRAVEAAAARRAKLLITETAHAARIVRSLAPGVGPVVVASGVDVDGFPLTRPAGRVPTVVFNTGLDAPAEIQDAADFCTSIVPAVRLRLPQTRFVVVSRDVPTRSEVSRRLRGVDVPAARMDPRLLFHDLAVAAAPLQQGLDVRCSALEAMAAGIPVVTTSRVRDYLGVMAGRECAVADSPDAFARELVELLESRVKREEIGANGRRFVKENFSWEECGQRLEALLGRVCGGSGGAKGGPTPRSLPAAFRG